MERILTSQTDEIIIADDLEENEDEIREVNAQFVQDSSFKGIKRSFTLFNKIQLHQTLQNFKNKKGSRYRINLRHVRQMPERHRQFARHSLMSFAGGLLCTVLLVAIWYYTEFKSDYLLMAAFLFAAASVIALLLFFYRSCDTCVYRSIAAGMPLIELDFGKPGQREFEAFTGLLENQIRKAQANDLNKQQRLAAELKDIRRLKDAGMLSEEDYSRARTLIFRHRDFSAN